MHLPVTAKEIQAGCLISSYFNDLYLFLDQNKLSSTKAAICKVEMLAENIYYYIHYYSSLSLDHKRKQHS